MGIFYFLSQWPYKASLLANRISQFYALFQPFWPLCQWDLLSSGMLREVDGLVVNPTFRANLSSPSSRPFEDGTDRLSRNVVDATC